MREADYAAFAGGVDQGITLATLEQRLRPGSASEGGFLGADEGLLEVIHSDWESVRNSGTSHHEIAEALESLLKGTHHTVSGFEFRRKADLEDVRTEILGKQGCPWQCSVDDKPVGGLTLGIIARAETFEERLSEMTSAVRDLFYNRTQGAASFFVVVSGLHPHLIGAHKFFEGRQSPYRAEPDLLIQALGLKRN